LAQEEDCGAYIIVKSAVTNLFVEAQVQEEQYMSPKKKTRKPRKNKPYSAGQMNKLVDDLFHPFYKDSEWYRVADGCIHGLVEKNLRVSAKKFVKYNLPEIVKKILEKI
jgi:hypothetical protein